jgi:hypothetical protein
MRFHLFTITLISALGLFGFGGCGGGSDSGKAEKAEHEHAADEHGHDDHAHSDEGPHGGHIIELGVEDYHVELTHDDDANKVGVYLLGSDAKTAAPIAATDVKINVSENGQATQYVLPAVAQEGETGGNASYFELVSEPLTKVVSGKSEAKTKKARLSLEIDGKPYVGLVEVEPHDHDHDHGHDH